MDNDNNKSEESSNNSSVPQGQINEQQVTTSSMSNDSSQSPPNSSTSFQDQQSSVNKESSQSIQTTNQKDNNQQTSSIGATQQPNTPAPTRPSFSVQEDFNKKSDINKQNSSSYLQQAPTPTQYTQQVDQTEHQKPTPDTNQNTAQQPPEQTSTPETSFSSVITAPKRSNKFKIFILILIIVAVVVYGVVGYLYFSRDNNDNSIQSNSPTRIPTAIPTTPMIPTQPPIPLSSQIELSSGNIIRKISEQESEILVNKNDYPDTGIIGFFDISVSPDEKYMCFYSVSPAITPSIYYSSTTGDNVTTIDTNSKNCIWSNESDKIAYTKTYPSQKYNDIFIYELATDQTINLTNQSSSSAELRQYSLISFSDNDETIICGYNNLTDEISDQTSLTTECEIDVQTGELLDI